MLDIVLVEKLVDALFAEAEIDLGTDFEKYARADEEEGRNLPEVPVQSDTKEALTLALTDFFSILPEPIQEEIARTIRQYAHAPQWYNLLEFVQPDPMKTQDYAVKWCRTALPRLRTVLKARRQEATTLSGSLGG